MITTETYASEVLASCMSLVRLMHRACYESEPADTGIVDEAFAKLVDDVSLSQTLVTELYPLDVLLMTRRFIDGLSGQYGKMRATYFMNSQVSMTVLMNDLNKVWIDHDLNVWSAGTPGFMVPAHVRVEYVARLNIALRPFYRDYASRRITNTQLRIKLESDASSLFTFFTNLAASEAFAERLVSMVNTQGDADVLTDNFLKLEKFFSSALSATKPPPRLSWQARLARSFKPGSEFQLP